MVAAATEGVVSLTASGHRPRTWAKSCASSFLKFSRNRGAGTRGAVRTPTGRGQSLGPPPRTSGEACASYFLKLSRNSCATFLAFSS